MSSRKWRVKEAWVRHPLLDLWLTAAATGLAGVYLPHEISDTGEDALRDFLAALSALASIAFAAETFACTMTYSSSNQFIQKVRAKHARVLRRTWTLILAATFLSAGAAIVALLGVETQWRVAATTAVGCGALVLTGFFRSLYWLRYTLFTDQIGTSLVIEDAPSGLPTVPRNKV